MDSGPAYMGKPELFAVDLVGVVLAVFESGDDVAFHGFFLFPLTVTLTTNYLIMEYFYGRSIA